MVSIFEQRLLDRAIEEEEQNRINDKLYAVRLANDFLNNATNNITWQKDFVLDDSLHKCLFGERRGAKSSVMAIQAIYTCLLTPTSKCLFIGLTQESVKQAFYDEVLTEFITTYNLPAELLGGDEMRFNNGSVIYLRGLDANKKQKSRVRGIKSSLNMIDEMQSHTQDTYQLINEVIGPTSADTKSPIILAGTAGDAIKAPYWHEITRCNTRAEPIKHSTKHPEYKVYRCMWQNNTAIDKKTGNRVCDNVREYLEGLKAKHPGIELTESWRQEWEAEWVILKDNLQYHYNNNDLSDPLCIDYATNEHHKMPPRNIVEAMTKVIAIDIGFNDEFSWVILGFNLKYNNVAYILESGGKPKMIMSDIIRQLNTLREQYSPGFWVGDSSNLTVFETLKQDYHFPFEKADRLGKESHIRFTNSYLQTRSVIFFPGNNRLIEQLNTCQWDKDDLKKGKYTEDESYKRDIADAFLYGTYYSRHMWYHAPKPPPTEEEYFNDQILRAEKKFQSEQNKINRVERLSPYVQGKSKYNQKKGNRYNPTQYNNIGIGRGKIR